MTREEDLEFSAAKAALDMQMSVSQSVIQSVSLSVCNAYLFVRFTSIFYNSKSDQMKLKILINQKTTDDTKHYSKCRIFKALKSLKLSQSQVL